ncbi:flagellar filament capping protein FliD [Gammaproteobacteria bacterium]|nr:flagellar filament capping protein FliD [Gammaproteobacteria bacterium]
MTSVDQASNQGTKITNALKVGSGVDIAELATSLSEAELSPKITSAEGKVSASETRLSALGILKSSISSINSALASLEDSSSLTDFNASSSLATSVSASTVSGASSIPGSYTVQASQLAGATSIVSNSFSSVGAAINSGNSFNLAFNQGPSPGVGTTVNVAMPTPSGVVSAINSANLGISASLLNKSAAVTENALTTFSDMTDGQTFTLAGITVTASGSVTAANVASAFASLSSGGSPNPVTGLSYSGSYSGWSTGLVNGASLRFTSTTAGGGVTDLAATGTNANLVSIATTQGVTDAWYISLRGETGLQNQFTLSSSPDLGFATNSNILTTAQNAVISVNGLGSINRATNSVSDVIAGVNLVLTGTSSATITVTEDLSSFRTKLDSVVNSINDFNAVLDELEGVVSEDSDLPGSLAGDSSFVSLLRSQVKAIVGKESATASGGMSTLRDLGLSFKLNGDIEIKEKTYAAVISNNLNDVKTMLTGGTDNQSRYDTASKGLALDSRVTLLGLIETGGIILNRDSSEKKVLKTEEAALVDLETRLSESYDRYIKQFAAMESLVQRSKSTGDYLKGQFTAMENMYSN